MIWLLSICISIEKNNKNRGIFHFRGYVKGQWVSKVVVELANDEEKSWEIGESYLLKLIIVNIDNKGILYGALKEFRILAFNLADNWEAY